jgi:hypothetical protein
MNLIQLVSVITNILLPGFIACLPISKSTITLAERVLFSWVISVVIVPLPLYYYLYSFGLSASPHTTNSYYSIIYFLLTLYVLVAKLVKSASTQN